MSTALASWSSTPPTRRAKHMHMLSSSSAAAAAASAASIQCVRRARIIIISRDGMRRSGRWRKPRKAARGATAAPASRPSWDFTSTPMVPMVPIRIHVIIRIDMIGAVQPPASATRGRADPDRDRTASMRSWPCSPTAARAGSSSSSTLRPDNCWASFCWKRLQLVDAVQSAPTSTRPRTRTRRTRPTRPTITKPFPPSGASRWRDGPGGGDTRLCSSASG
mmetsp:Transcript_27693/g.79945  ORF Transcript_27693/g.79945 Transcript_27693/m.79945 type:complete len:221 (+) Transcript_27693:226-888(+)